MRANDGIVISDTAPDEFGKITWLKINPDGSREWYRKSDGEWELYLAEDAPAFADHTHDHLDELADIVTLLNSGVNGTKTIAGHQVTFNHGVLVDYQAP